MSMPGLEFDLGEMADTIRDTTERFAREQITFAGKATEWTHAIEAGPFRLKP